MAVMPGPPHSRCSLLPQPPSRWWHCAGALLAGGLIASATGAESSARFAVSATVEAQASLHMESAPIALEVSAADVSRGYIDLSEPLRLRIASNSTEGFALDIAPLGSLLAGFAIYGMDQDIRFGADGGTIVQRWQHGQAVLLDLRFRFVLASGLPPGHYPYPLRLAVRPLEHSLQATR